MDMAVAYRALNAVENPIHRRTGFFFSSDGRKRRGMANEKLIRSVRLL